MLSHVATLLALSAFLAMPFVLFSYFRSLRRFVTLLSERHDDEWTRLGQPTIGFGDGPQSTNQLVDYVWKRGFQDLDDSEISEIGERCRLLLVSGFAIFAALLIFGMMSQK